MNFKTTLLAACLGACACTAWAYDQPSVNMGGTSFFDGAPLPGGPGFYFVEYLTHYSASRMMDNSGNTAAFPPSQKFDLTVPVSQLIYVPEGARWGNKQLGFQALLPWVAQARVSMTAWATRCSRARAASAIWPRGSGCSSIRSWARRGRCSRSASSCR